MTEKIVTKYISRMMADGSMRATSVIEALEQNAYGVPAVAVEVASGCASWR